MAAAAHFSADVYGIGFGSTPFQNASGQAAFTKVQEFPKWLSMSFPTAGSVITPLQNGFPVTNTQGNFFVYSVIEVLPTGLNTHGDKYLSSTAAATLATNAG